MFFYFDDCVCVVVVAVPLVVPYVPVIDVVYGILIPPRKFIINRKTPPTRGGIVFTIIAFVNIYNYTY